MIYLPAHIANTIKLAIRKIDFTVGFIFLTQVSDLDIKK